MVVQLESSRWLQQVEIRHLTRDDLSALEWDGEYSHFRRVFQAAYKRTQRGLSLLWVVDLPGTGIIGQVFVQLVCDRKELADGFTRAYLYSFRIKPLYRGIGLGSRMLQHVERALMKRGFRFLTLNVAKTNQRARRLYERLGYYVTAHEPGCWSYPDHNGVWQRVEEPAWRMEKKLF